MDQNQLANELARIVRNRKTEKVMCEVESHQSISHDVATRNREIVLEAIKTAGWAPFHYPRNVGGMAEPCDEEHLAATSAMVQNLLLLLTANEMGSYWSSGGRFRSEEMFKFLGIDPGERFLAGVFIEYPELIDDTKERKAGAHREKRSESWIREVSL